MTLTELVAAVVAKVKRPDLSSQIKAAVLAEVYAAHSLGVFDFDVRTVAVELPEAAYVHNVEIVAAYSDFREAHSIIPLDSNSDPLAPPLRRADPGEIVDQYATVRSDCWFRIGSNLVIRCSRKFQYFRMVYRSNPDLTDSGFNSTIATLAPYYIIEMAASVIFGDIGKKDESQVAQARAQRYLTPVLERLLIDQGA